MARFLGRNRVISKSDFPKVPKSLSVFVLRANFRNFSLLENALRANFGRFQCAKLRTISDQIEKIVLSFAHWNPPKLALRAFSKSEKFRKLALSTKTDSDFVTFGKSLLEITRFRPKKRAIFCGNRFFTHKNYTPSPPPGSGGVKISDGARDRPGSNRSQFLSSRDGLVRLGLPRVCFCPRRTRHGAR